jgi:hypothetical protein
MSEVGIYTVKDGKILREEFLPLTSATPSSRYVRFQRFAASRGTSRKARRCHRADGNTFRVSRTRRGESLRITPCPRRDPRP